jgi:chromosome segregation ATPase
MNKEFEQWADDRYGDGLLLVVLDVYKHLQSNPHLLKEDGEKEEHYEDAEQELSLEHEVHKLTLANVAAEEYIKLLEQQVIDLKADRDSIYQELNGAIEERNELKDKLGELREEIESLKHINNQFRERLYKDSKLNNQEILDSSFKMVQSVNHSDDKDVEDGDEQRLIGYFPHHPKDKPKKLKIVGCAFR